MNSEGIIATASYRAKERKWKTEGCECPGNDRFDYQPEEKCFRNKVVLKTLSEPVFKSHSPSEKGKPQTGRIERANSMHRTKEPGKITTCDQTGFLLFEAA